MEEYRSKYFERQMKVPAIGIDGQQRLETSSALVVGLGGLGCPAALQLATAGVGRIGIMDGDRVELTNLHRQTAYTVHDVGKPKTKCLAAFLRDRVPGIQIESIPSFFHAGIGGQALSDYSIILDCTDLIAAKCAISDAAIKAHRPLVTASVYRTSAQIALFSGSGNPCYRCLYPDIEAVSLASCSDVGVLAVQTALAGTYQASLAIRFLLNPDTIHTDRNYQLEWESMQIYETRIQGRKNCTACGVDAAGKRQSDRPSEASKLAPGSKTQSALRNNADQSMHVTWEQVRSWASEGRLHLVDVREFDEIQENPIVDAQHFPLSRIRNGLSPERRADAILVLVCETGQRSMEAAIQLSSGGPVHSILGGRRSLA